MNWCNENNLVKSQIIKHLSKYDVDQICLTNKECLTNVCKNDHLWKSLTRTYFHKNTPTHKNPRLFFYEQCLVLFGYGDNTHGQLFQPSPFLHAFIPLFSGISNVAFGNHRYYLVDGMGNLFESVLTQNHTYTMNFKRPNVVNVYLYDIDSTDYYALLTTPNDIIIEDTESNSVITIQNERLLSQDFNQDLLIVTNYKIYSIPRGYNAIVKHFDLLDFSFSYEHCNKQLCTLTVKYKNKPIDVKYISATATGIFITKSGDLYYFNKLTRYVVKLAEKVDFGCFVNGSIVYTLYDHVYIMDMEKNNTKIYRVDSRVVKMDNDGDNIVIVTNRGILYVWASVREDNALFPERWENKFTEEPVAVAENVKEFKVGRGNLFVICYDCELAEKNKNIIK